MCRRIHSETSREHDLHARPSTHAAAIRDRRRGQCDQHSETGSRGGRVIAAPRSVARILLGRRGQAVTAAAHDLVRVRRKLRLRAVSGHHAAENLAIEIYEVPLPLPPAGIRALLARAQPMTG